MVVVAPRPIESDPLIAVVPRHETVAGARLVLEDIREGGGTTVPIDTETTCRGTTGEGLLEGRGLVEGIRVIVGGRSQQTATATPRRSLLAARECGVGPVPVAAHTQHTSDQCGLTPALLTIVAFVECHPHCGRVSARFLQVQPRRLRLRCCTSWVSFFFLISRSGCVFICGRRLNSCDTRHDP